METTEKLSQINAMIDTLSHMGTNIGEQERLEAINLLSEYAALLSK